MTDTDTSDIDRHFETLGRALDAHAPPVVLDDLVSESHYPSAKGTRPAWVRMPAAAAAVLVLVAALAVLAHRHDAPVTTETATTNGSAATAPVTAATGSTVAILTIPAIGVDVDVHEGVDTDQLRLGPGHDPNSAPIGTVGRAVLFSWRTTYGGWFRDLDQLRPGDEIVASTPAGEFRYQVQPQADGSGHRIVAPADAVFAAADTALLTLVSDDPKYSASNRIIVDAELVSPPATPPPG